MKRDEIVLTLRRFKEANKDRYEIIRIGIFGSAGGQKSRSGLKMKRCG